MERAITLHSQVCKADWSLRDDELAPFTALNPPQIQRETSAMAERFHADVDRMLRKASTVERRTEIKRLRGAMLDLIFIRNAAALIHVKLPNELLQEVFSHIQPATRSDIRAIHVCRIWRSFIIGLPKFWAEFLGAPKMYIIRKGDPQAVSMLTVFLARSAPNMHGLSLHGRNLAVVDPSQLTRLSSLYLLFKAKNLPAVHRFLGLHMPNLRSLTMRFHCKREEPPRRALRGPARSYGDNFPRLHHLSTSGIFLPEYLTAPSIIHLELAECVESCGLHLPGELRMSSIDALVKFVASCPGLESFQLTNCTPEDVFDADFSTPRLHLPHLRTFTVDDDDWEWGSKLLYCFVFPPTTQLRFLCNSGELEEIIPVSRFPELLSSIDCVVVRLVPDNFKLPCCTVQGFSHAAERLSLTARDFYYSSEVGEKMLHDLIQLLPTPLNILSLNIEIHDGLSITQDAWKDALCVLSALRSLALRAGSLDELLHALGQEGVCPPQLEMLVLASGRWDSEVLLVSALTHWAARGHRLEKLTLLGLAPDEEIGTGGGAMTSVPSEECVNRLKALVPDVSVIL
ncbi:hypothetical protein C8T65DRAFT_737645 [Cerioporus squamosus]|nr:hypothetical protein C8T65DRAFT_737645 [Cerioporus squamosus]